MYEWRAYTNIRTAIHDYNVNMNSVDRADNLRSDYETSLKSGTRSFFGHLIPGYQIPTLL